MTAFVLLAMMALPASSDAGEAARESFPRFEFARHEEQAQLLSSYLWYHFSNRLGNGRTVFNKEYLTVADMWMGGATDERRKKSIQAVHREDILSIQIDEEGYVHTHQHFSHAHDTGWPFPLWTQADSSPDGVAGKAAGWHFQTDLPDAWWVTRHLKGWNRPEYMGETAAERWELHNVRSLGIVENKWRLEATGDSPTITTPPGMEIDAFHAPFLQLRWTRDPVPSGGALPYIEWMREEDDSFGEDRRVYFVYADAEAGRGRLGPSGTTHCMITMHSHPRWSGKIKRMRISLAPGERDVAFAIDSFFTVYDTRHSINNPIFIFACWNYFRWTGDLDFLRENINRMRTALRYQQIQMGGLKYKRIRNEWPGHDGLPGFSVNPDGSKTIHGGHGIGSNYWDLLPFGWDDMYATSQYYAATLVMADLEEAIQENPGWHIPLGALALDHEELRRHASEVKREAGRLFWDRGRGRFVGCIDKQGTPRDYGFTFLNLDAIWYGIADDRQAGLIMDWIDGRRIIEGDTSTGEDIYRWRFGPRATTKRNVEWYGQVWYKPERIPWGGQIQDGGAVLGFAFYDLWARLKVFGPDDAWRRLCAILDWEKDARAAGGYREFYRDGKQGATLQGGGTAGGIGVDFEFFESSMIPAAVVMGFMGLNPGAAELAIRPRLPEACPRMTVRNVLYRGVRLDVTAADGRIDIDVRDQPREPLRVRLDEGWSQVGAQAPGPVFTITNQGAHRFRR